MARFATITSYCLSPTIRPVRRGPDGGVKDHCHSPVLYFVNFVLDAFVHGAHCVQSHRVENVERLDCPAIAERVL
jgi:hypothetical protein